MAAAEEQRGGQGASQSKNSESGEFLITPGMRRGGTEQREELVAEMQSAGPPVLSDSERMAKDIQKKFGYRSVAELATNPIFTSEEDLAERIEAMTADEAQQFGLAAKLLASVSLKGVRPLFLYSRDNAGRPKQMLVLMICNQVGGRSRTLLDFEQIIVPSIQHAAPKLNPRRMDIVLASPDEFYRIGLLCDSKEVRDRFLDRLDEESSIQKAVIHVVRSALRLGASDIHIEPNKRGKYEVRFRINGVLQPRMEMLEPRARQFVSRLKVMSGSMRVEEKRFDQDGRIVFSPREIEEFFPGDSSLFKQLSLRVATVPALGGEAVTLRLLRGAQNERLNLKKIGLPEHVEHGLRRVMRSPNGMVLVTGPTGSGKTTSLYACLSELNDGSRCIVTAENPVEMPIEGIRQVQVNNAIKIDGNVGENLNFARILRSFLRQDPDVILVGEIRDDETSEIALSASLTGHLVFATLHTNDSFSTVQRLAGLGISGPELHDALRGVLSQRLVRCLCGECKEPFDAAPELKEILGSAAQLIEDGESYHLFRPSGKTSTGSECEDCKGTGYDGRKVIAELWIPGDQEKAMIAKGQVAVHELLQSALSSGFRSMVDDALEHLKAGTIDLTELLKVADANALAKRGADVIKALRTQH
jgi:type II secretory ATPase GspE/PulE/Tfp pilus assembly ATPase PilB-like protein